MGFKTQSTQSIAELVGAAAPQKQVAKSPDSGRVLLSMAAYIRHKDKLMLVKGGAETDNLLYDPWGVPASFVSFGQKPEDIIGEVVKNVLGLKESDLDVHFPVQVYTFLKDDIFCIAVGWHCTLKTGSAVSLGKGFTDWEWFAKEDKVGDVSVNTARRLADYWAKAEEIGIDLLTGQLNNYSSEGNSWPVR